MAKLFISYSRVNLEIVQKIRQDLQNAGIDVWIDQVGLTPGTPDWDQALRDAISKASAVLFIASPDSRRSPYVRDEIALAKDAKKPIYPLWVDGNNWLDCVPMGLGSTQNVDLRDDAYHKNLPRLIGTLGGQTNIDQEPVAPLVPDTEPEALRPANPRNPYKGLRAFTSEDTSDFFGRDTVIEEFLDIVADEKRPARLLAVLGASGSGKSSIMMAGLLPRLKQEYPDWTFLNPIVPGTNPIEKLTIMLARQFENKSQSVIEDDLRNRNTRGLHRIASELTDKPVVLYIDQFEEIFTLVDKETNRRHFIDILTTAVTEPDGVLYLLLSMRADFYDRPLQYNNFGKLIENHHVAVTPMTLADLYDVVQKPAQLSDVGVTFDDGLVTEMVFAVREETAALPLLQFTLDQLFEARHGHKLTLQAYQDLGGIQGALAGHADATYAKLPSDQHRHLARTLFLRLIEPGQTEQDTTRRRATYSELTLPDVEQTRILQETADVFVNARLLVTDQTGDKRTIEVSHEALIREWARLGDWLLDAREDLRLQKSLSADVTRWLELRKPVAMLYRGTILAAALAWAERNSASRDETMFLNESRRVEDERKRREAKNQRNLRYALFGLVGVIVVASISLVLIFAQNNADLQSEAELIQSTLTLVPSTLTQVSNLLEQAENEVATSDSAVATAEANAIELVFTATYAQGISIAEANNAQTQAAIAATAQQNAINQLNVGATSEAQVEYLQAQIDYVATREFVISLLDITQTPVNDFYATATAYVESNNGAWQPIIQEFDGVAMVKIPAGCFFMGSIDGNLDERPVHEVCVDEFWIDQYEVTNAQYGSTGCGEDIASEPDHPRNCVSWFDAKAHCEGRDARLPTEAEWEYAARGPDSLVYPWGNEWNEDYTIWVGNSERKTVEVGSLSRESASWVGAYDMIGNVSEWVNTIYEPYPYETYDGREDESDDTSARVLRGNDMLSIDAVSLRAFNRMRDTPTYAGYSFGFRCAGDG